jgi:hypothetical protein
VRLVNAENLPYQAHGIVVDPDTEQAQCTIVRPTNGTGSTPYEIWHIAVDAGGSPHAKNLVANDVWKVREPNVGSLVLRVATKELIVPYVSHGTGIGTDRRAKVARAVPGTSPSWTIDTVSTTSSDSPIGSAFFTPSATAGQKSGIAIMDCGIDPLPECNGYFEYDDDVDDGLPHLFWLGSLNVDFAYTLWHSKGGNAGDPWTVPDALYVTDPATDYLDFLSASALYAPAPPPPPPLVVTCPVGAGAGLVGVPYGPFSIPTSGGTPPYSWAVTGGALPPGITLNGSTGVISGTPTTAGSYSYTITVTDADSNTATPAAPCGIVITQVTDTCAERFGPKIYFWEPAFLERPEDIAKRATDWEDSGLKGAKFVQGFFWRPTRKAKTKPLCFREIRQTFKPTSSTTMDRRPSPMF